MIDKKLKIDDLEISYFECGGDDGTPVFLLHGWGGSKESWIPLLENLDQKSSHYFALDLPGFGKTTEPSKAWAIENYVQFFENFVQKIYAQYNLEGGYDLIVHSFGGRMAILITSGQENSPSRPFLERLILIGAAGIKPKKTFKMILGQTLAKIGKIFSKVKIFEKASLIARKFLYKFLRAHDYEKTSGIMRETFLKVIAKDLRSRIHAIKNPTLIIWGEQDGAVPLADAKFMHEQIKGSILKTIKDGRHGIHKTHAEQVGKWINEFLNA